MFLTSDRDDAPAVLAHNLKHNHVLHAQNLIVTVTLVTTPYVPDAERVTIIRLTDRFVLIEMAFG